MTQYTSPLRPLDIGYVQRTTGIAIDWSHTEIGQWTPTMRYGFVRPLPDAYVEAFELRPVPIPTLPPWWDLDAAGLAERMKAEILEDIDKEIVNPDLVRCYSDLHDYVDANSYGGVFESMPPGIDPDADVLMEPWYAVIGAAQEIVNVWLEHGGHRAAR